jgi:hypothetical protein
MIIIDLCLSDIPEAKRRKAKNGKWYTSIAVDSKKDGVDQYGNTHNVFMSQTKEERTAKEKKAYVGNAKEYLFNDKPTPESTPNQSNNQSSTDDLPW